MTRARQVANFDPALFAADEVSGDKVSGGTIGAGVIGASVTGGAGLSGMTSLGTVTVGNLSNTAITYPTGHILQVGHTISNTTESDGSKTANQTVTSLEVSMTAINTNGKYLLTCNSPYTSSNYGSNQMKIFFAVNENTAGYSNKETTVGTCWAKNGGGYSGYGFQPIYFQYLYTASITAGQNIKFRPMYQYTTGGGTDTIFYAAGNGYCNLTVFELEL